MTKEDVLGLVGDTVSNFLYYDRKGDEQFPIGTIEELVRNGIITVDEIAEKFRSDILKRI